MPSKLTTRSLVLLAFLFLSSCFFVTAEVEDSLTKLRSNNVFTDADTEGMVFSDVGEDTELFEGFDPSVPTSYDVMYSHFKKAVRFLMGSNCVLIETGKVPIYEQCYGCSMRESYACLQDMRHNVTGNVPHGCDMMALAENPDTSCCPKFYRRKDGTWGPVLFEYSAYPMVFECLKEVGCEDTQIFTDLMAECYHVCDGVKGIYNNDIYFTCTAIPSPAPIVFPRPFLYSVCLAILLLLQLYY